LIPFHYTFAEALQKETLLYEDEKYDKEWG